MRSMPRSPSVQCSRESIFLALLGSLCAAAADLRVGVIGTDTSHVPAFAKLLNGDPSAPDHIAGARVVAVYKGGSKDIEESIGRVDRFAEEVKTQYGVEIVPTFRRCSARWTWCCSRAWTGACTWSRRGR